MKKNTGITLIALVITIIVLIILAGISINLVLVENGIITRAKEARKQQEIAQIKEEIQLDIMAIQTENKGNMTEEELRVILETKGTLSEEENILDRTLTTENGYEIKVSDIYNGELEEDEVVVEKITATDIQNDASYIGKYVNYGGEETYKGVKWRIFNSEDGKIQLIANNYVAFSELPTATNIAAGSYSNYCVTSNDNRIALLNYINTTSNWSDFVEVIGATVTGSPTIEQFAKSYNRTHGADSEADVKEIFIAKSAKMDDELEGYYVGTTEDPKGFGISGLNTTEMENLYIINDDTNANGYWLNSPSANIIDCLTFIHFSNGIGAGAYNYQSIALRPLITLPSGTILIEQENGSYNVK